MEHWFEGGRGRAVAAVAWLVATFFLAQGLLSTELINMENPYFRRGMIVLAINAVILGVALPPSASAMAIFGGLVHAGLLMAVCGWVQGCLSFWLNGGEWPSFHLTQVIVLLSFPWLVFNAYGLAADGVSSRPARGRTATEQRVRVVVRSSWVALALGLIGPVLWIGRVVYGAWETGTEAPWRVAIGALKSLLLW